MSVLWTLLLNVPLGVGAYWIARHGFRQPAGPPRWLAAAVLAWAWATLGMQVLGSLGALTRGPLALLSALGLAIGLGLRLADRRAGSPIVPGPEGEGRRPWAFEALAALGLVFWGGSALALTSQLGPVKVVSDGPIYHLYFAARWWKAGRIFLVASPFGENAATYFPAVGDLWFAWLFVGWGGDRLAKIGQLPFLLACGCASYALARRLGAGRSSSLVAMTWFLASTPLLLFSFEANVDTIFIAGYLMAAYFFLKFALGDGGVGLLALGALAAGGALGTKATGIVFVPVLLALALVVALGRSGSPAEKAGRVAAVLLLPGVMAGFWYGRNALLTGNPLYPLHIEAFGRVWLPGWYGSDVMRLSQYYLPRESWQAFLDILLSVLDPRLAPVWLASLAGAWAIGREPRPLGRWVWACSALAALNIAGYWLLIPYRTQQRFMLQALGLAAVPVALTLDRARAFRMAGVLLLAIHLFTPQEWPFAARGAEPPWDFVPGITNAVPPPVPLPWVVMPSRGGGASAEEVRANALVLAMGLGALVVAWAWARADRRPSRRRTAVAWGVTAAVSLAGVAAAAPGAGAVSRFYPPFRDYYAGWLQVEGRSGAGGARVAYAGMNLPFYLLAADMRNEVRYVNVDGHRDWLLHDYHREARSRGEPTWPHPRPGWDRIHPDYDAWLANLRAEGIQLLAVARANPREGPHNVADTEGFPVERHWADTHPEAFELLYGEAEGDPLFRLYRVRPAAPHPR